MRSKWFLQNEYPHSPVPTAHSPSQLFKTGRVVRDNSLWVKGLPPAFAYDMPKTLPLFLAIGGGKGGVGKSLVSSNLSGVIAKQGYKVLVIDLDIGGSNLHTYFGLPFPAKNLSEFILGSSFSFADAIIPTQVPGVSIIAGGQDESWSDTPDLSNGALDSLWHALLHIRERQGFDFVIFDLGAGTHRHTIDFFLSAHLGMVVVLPEPTSIENAYSFLKSMLWRLIEHAGVCHNLPLEADLIKEKIFHSGKGTSAFQTLMSLKSTHPTIIHHVLGALQGRELGFVINQIRSQRDIDVGPSMKTIAHQYFGFQTSSLGYLNFDDAAWKALRNRRLLLSDFPHSIIVKKLSEIARQIINNLE